jgi:hypothetical protein
MLVNRRRRSRRSLWTFLRLKRNEGDRKKQSNRRKQSRSVVDLQANRREILQKKEKKTSELHALADDALKKFIANNGDAEKKAVTKKHSPIFGTNSEHDTSFSRASL